ncbi:MAG: thymidylate synthase [Myxococcota bacterium]
MKVFSGQTASDVWLAAAAALAGPDAAMIPGRGGATRELLHAAFEVGDSRQRWVFEREPAMNPAFALAEVVWIVLGRDDAAFPNFWNPALSKFAGADSSYHGAYGARLRRHRGVDQLARVADTLRANPASRQAVLQIWDATADLPTATGEPVAADIPCNVTSLLKVRGGRLEWLQVIRSNDIFLGTPHNFVQFMSLQEILAGWIGVDVGTYVQISDSLHVYERDLSSISTVGGRIAAPNTDRFSEPREESLAHFSAVGARMDEMRRKQVSPERCSELALGLDVPESYRNVLLVVGADAARRRGGIDQASILMAQCTNPAYHATWSRWCARMAERCPTSAAQDPSKASAPDGSGS